MAAKSLKSAAIGIDCKGKEINISFIDSFKKEIKKERPKTVNGNNLPETLSNILKKINPDNSIPLIAAISPKEEKEYSDGLPKNLDFISRREAIYRASLIGKPGMLLEADFESKAFILDEKGNLKNFKTKGDDCRKGSSCWINDCYGAFKAETAKKTSLNSTNRPVICAEKIIKKAENNDLKAARIIDFAQADLCNLVLKTLINAFGITKEINIVLAGELIENKFFRSSLIRKIRASIKTCSIHAKVNICPPRHSIAFECARLALDIGKQKSESEKGE